MADPRDVTPNAAKDPDDWVTGEEPPPDDLSKADASKAIEDLQQKAGRGT